MYEVIGSTTSRAFRVVWALEEMGLDYTYLPEAPHSELVTSLNPSGKLPVFRADGTVITDSTAIITYLADKHNMITYPAGTLERAAQDSMTNQILDEIDSILWVAARNTFILPKDKRVPEIKETLRWEFARNIARISDRFAGPFLMGDKFTIPDIILTNCMGWAHGAKFPGADDRLLAYSKEMRNRGAFERTKNKS